MCVCVCVCVAKPVAVELRCHATALIIVIVFNDLFLVKCYTCICGMIKNYVDLSDKF